MVKEYDKVNISMRDTQEKGLISYELQGNRKDMIDFCNKHNLSLRVDGSKEPLADDEWPYHLRSILIFREVEKNMNSLGVNRQEILSALLSGNCCRWVTRSNLLLGGSDLFLCYNFFDRHYDKAVCVISSRYKNVVFRVFLHPRPLELLNPKLKFVRIP